MERLLDLGVRSVPVIAKGKNFIFAQNFEDIAEFVGLQGSGHTALPPDQIFAKWLLVCRAAQRYVVQFPDARLFDRAIENRDRTIRSLAHHTFRIGEAFLDTVVDGAEYTPLFANLPPPDGAFTTGREISAYGEAVVARLSAWWEHLEDRSCTATVQTYFGPQPVHLLLERSTWHAAQHARQLAALLGRFGIEADGPLTAEDLAGLPLPERLWE